jgi:hypothetical protein
MHFDANLQGGVPGSQYLYLAAVGLAPLRLAPQVWRAARRAQLLAGHSGQGARESLTLCVSSGLPSGAVCDKGSSQLLLHFEFRGLRRLGAFSTFDNSFRPLTKVFRPNTSAFDLRRSVFKKSMCDKGRSRRPEGPESVSM